MKLMLSFVNAAKKKASNSVECHECNGKAYPKDEALKIINK